MHGKGLGGDDMKSDMGAGLQLGGRHQVAAEKASEQGLGTTTSEASVEDWILKDSCRVSHYPLTVFSSRPPFTS